MKCLITAVVIIVIVGVTPVVVYIGFDVGTLLFGPDRWYMTATTMLLFVLLWVGWELHRVANRAADCSDKFGTVQIGISNIEDGITTAGTDIVDAINSQAKDINDRIAAIEYKLPD